MQKLKSPPLYILLFASALQAIGIGLMSTLSTSGKAVQNVEYGYEVVMGLSFGLSLSTLIMMTPLVFEKRDMGK